MIKVLTVGVFDFFHLGHLRLFKNSKRKGNYLIVAVQRDILKYKPNIEVIYSLKQRLEMVSSIKYVDEVVIYDDVDKIVKEIDFDIFIKGPDQNHDGFKRAIEYCKNNNKKVIVLPRTKSISSTNLRDLFRVLK